MVTQVSRRSSITGLLTCQKAFLLGLPLSLIEKDRNIIDINSGLGPLATVLGGKHRRDSKKCSVHGNSINLFRCLFFIRDYCRTILICLTCLKLLCSGIYIKKQPKQQRTGIASLLLHQCICYKRKQNVQCTLRKAWAGRDWQRHYSIPGTQAFRDYSDVTLIPLHG